MRVIVDTSALAALYFPEELSEFARGVLERSEEYHFLDLAYYEFANIVRKRVARSEVSREVGNRILRQGLELISASYVHDGRSLIADAYELSLKYSITVYDASLLVLAKRVEGKVLTTDAKRLRAVRAHENLFEVPPSVQDP